MTTKVSVGQAGSWRLGRHHLSRRAAKRELAKVVSDVCGIQAQVLSAAELAVRARVEGVSRQDVRDALWKDHSIVKTWCMRGTLHLLASSDLSLYVGALRSKLKESVNWLQQVQGVAPQEVAVITSAIREVISRRPLTREELSHEVERRTDLSPETRKKLRSAWGIMLRPASYQGRLVFAESQGPRAVFVNPALWITPGREPPMKDAFRELFRRYVRSYGPVTVGDFGHWWGGLGDDARSAVESASGELEQVDLEGFRGLMLRRDAEEASGLEPAKGVHLLPSFDCYPMFYSPREMFVPQAHRGRIFRQTAGWNYPSLVVDGLAAGIWGLKRRRNAIDIEVEPFRTLRQNEKQGVLEEGSDIARFLGMKSEIRYRPLGMTSPR